MRMSGYRHRVSHDARIYLLALAAGLPGTVIALRLAWMGSFSPKVQWTVAAVVLSFWLGGCAVLREQVVRPLRTLSNLLAALREGDFSIRASAAGSGDALGATLAEVNALGEILRQQRLGAVEATALMRKVMDEIDVSVLAFDGHRRLRLVNRAGERLLGRTAEKLLGRSAEELSLGELLTGEVPRTVEAVFPNESGHWELRRSSFRQDGHPHELVVLADLQRALREEERLAWKRLIRVLGHEINNSLAPIRSIAANLQAIANRSSSSADWPADWPADWKEDLVRGLSVIERRADALGRFMESYARLAKLPPPRLQPVDVGAWVRRVLELEGRVRIELEPGPDLAIQADGDQLDQLLINLVRNAVDAAEETGGGVRVEWFAKHGLLELVVSDEGPGIRETTNLFVPFFTTKPKGTGIGLALCRQIAEAHRGYLTLHNREDRRGCVARLRLPLPGP
jgi:two-component system nitrogen regulation sensor histidine kinase NtrY